MTLDPPMIELSTWPATKMNHEFVTVVGTYIDPSGRVTPLLVVAAPLRPPLAEDRSALT
jgi:hypothetical protein